MRFFGIYTSAVIILAHLLSRNHRIHLQIIASTILLALSHYCYIFMTAIYGNISRVDFEAFGGFIIINTQITLFGIMIIFSHAVIDVIITFIPACILLLLKAKKI